MENGITFKKNEIDSCQLFNSSKVNPSIGITDNILLKRNNQKNMAKCSSIYDDSKDLNSNLNESKGFTVSHGMIFVYIYIYIHI